MTGTDSRAVGAQLECNVGRLEPEREMHFTECPHGGYNERLAPDLEPWATLAPLCWDNPSAFRMGWEAEAHSIAGNPYRSHFARGVFEAGRQRCKEGGFAGKKTLPDSKTPNAELTGRAGLAGEGPR